MIGSKALIGASAVQVCAELDSLLLTIVIAKGNSVPVKTLVIISPDPPPIKHHERVAGHWSYDCEFPVQRPETIMLTSGDGDFSENSLFMTPIFVVGQP